MKHLKFLFTPLFILISGCHTPLENEPVAPSEQPKTLLPAFFTSSPPGAVVTVYKLHGGVVGTCITPDTLRLAEGYYQYTLGKEGFLASDGAGLTVASGSRNDAPLVRLDPIPSTFPPATGEINGPDTVTAGVSATYTITFQNVATAFQIGGGVVTNGSSFQITFQGGDSQHHANVEVVTYGKNSQWGSIKKQVYVKNAPVIGNPTASFVCLDVTVPDSIFVVTTQSTNGAWALLNGMFSPLNGQITLKLSSTSSVNFFVSALNGGMPATFGKIVTVRNMPLPAKPSGTLTVDSLRVVLGSSVTFTSVATGADYGILAPLGSYIPLGNGTVTFRPTITQSYKMSYIGRGGTDTSRSVTVVVTNPIIVVPPSLWPYHIVNVVNGTLSDIRPTLICTRAGKRDSVLYDYFLYDSIEVSSRLLWSVTNRVDTFYNRFSSPLAESLKYNRQYVQVTRAHNSTQELFVRSVWRTRALSELSPSGNLFAPDSTNSGQSFWLRWTGRNAISADLGNNGGGYGPVGVTDSLLVSTGITSDTRYTLRWTGVQGTIPYEISKWVRVRPVRPPARVTLTLASSPVCVTDSTIVRQESVYTDSVTVDIFVDNTNVLVLHKKMLRDSTFWYRSASVGRYRVRAIAWQGGIRANEESKILEFINCTVPCTIERNAIVNGVSFATIRIGQTVRARFWGRTTCRYTGGGVDFKLPVNQTYLNVPSNITTVNLSGGWEQQNGWLRFNGGTMEAGTPWEIQFDLTGRAATNYPQELRLDILAIEGSFNVHADYIVIP